MTRKQVNIANNFLTNLITILEIGEETLFKIEADQIDQAASLIDNRDRLINIYKASTEDRSISNQESKLITKILDQDQLIVEKLEWIKSKTRTTISTLKTNKNKIDRYRQTT